MCARRTPIQTLFALLLGFMSPRQDGSCNILKGPQDCHALSDAEHSLLLNNNRYCLLEAREADLQAKSEMAWEIICLVAVLLLCSLTLRAASA